MSAIMASLPSESLTGTPSKFDKNNGGSQVPSRKRARSLPSVRRDHDSGSYRLSMEDDLHLDSPVRKTPKLVDMDTPPEIRRLTMRHTVAGDPTDYTVPRVFIEPSQFWQCQYCGEVELLTMNAIDAGHISTVACQWCNNTDGMFQWHDQ